MQKITLHKVVFSKERLDAIPDCQRAVLVYAGHICNEINWFNKLLLILQQTGKEVAQKIPDLSSVERATMDGNTTQLMIVQRLYAGKICEAIKFLQRWCFDMPWFETASSEMEDEGRQSLANLQKYLAMLSKNPKRDVMRLVRDKFSFHYDEKAVKQSARVTELTEEFVTYLQDSVGNTLYLGSEHSIMGFLIEYANQGDTKTFIELLSDDVLDVGRSVNLLLGHTLAWLCFKYLGKDLPGIGHQEDIVMESPILEEIRLPFFASSNRKVDV
jgi:hypothetical protein